MTHLITNPLNIFLLNDSTNGFNFYCLNLLSFLCIVFSIITIISKNPVFSILFLIGLFLSISIYLILIGLTFIAIAYLLVYIGGVSMLFLFILMLIDIRISELHVQTYNSLFLAFLIGILFYINSFNFYMFIEYINENLHINISNYWDGYMIENYDIISIGNVLYSNLSIWLIVSSLILLLAMVGAIIININNKVLSNPPKPHAYINAPLTSSFYKQYIAKLPKIILNILLIIILRYFLGPDFFVKYLGLFQITLQQCIIEFLPNNLFFDKIKNLFLSFNLVFDKIKNLLLSFNTLFDRIKSWFFDKIKNLLLSFNTLFDRIKNWFFDKIKNSLLIFNTLLNNIKNLFLNFNLKNLRSKFHRYIFSVFTEKIPQEGIFKSTNNSGNVGSGPSNLGSGNNSNPAGLEDGGGSAGSNPRNYNIPRGLPPFSIRNFPGLYPGATSHEVLLEYFHAKTRTYEIMDQWTPQNHIVSVNNYIRAHSQQSLLEDKYKYLAYYNR